MSYAESLDEDNLFKINDHIKHLRLLFDLPLHLLQKNNKLTLYI